MFCQLHSLDRCVTLEYSRRQALLISLDFDWSTASGPCLPVCTGSIFNRLGHFTAKSTG